MSGRAIVTLSKKEESDVIAFTNAIFILNETGKKAADDKSVKTFTLIDKSYELKTNAEAAILVLALYGTINNTNISWNKS